MSAALSYDPADPEKMRLPVGASCGGCYHMARCKGLIGCKESNTRCDWSPSRFWPAPETPPVAAPVAAQPTTAFRVVIVETYTTVYRISAPTAEDADELARMHNEEGVKSLVIASGCERDVSVAVAL